MAINFLDTVNFNGNSLNNIRIQNVPTDPSTSVAAGDLIFNTTSNVLKYYDGTTPFSSAGWISLPDGVGIGGSGTVGTVPVFVTDTTTIGDSNITISGSVTTITGSLKLTGRFYDTSSSSGTSGQLLSSTATGTSWIDAPVSYTKWIADGGAATTEDVNDGDTYTLLEATGRPGIFAEAVTKSGTTITQPLGLFTKNMSLSSPADYATDVLLWGTDVTADDWKVQKTKFTDVPISTWAQAEADLALDGFKITDVGAPTAGGDAANKTYVDAAVAGGLNVKGGFNATTGAIATGGNLTSGGSRVAIAIGDYYVVTTAGDFFGNTATPLTPGDSVLVQTAAAAGASVEGDFAVIQSDTDVATATTIGIGNVANSTVNNDEGLSLSYSNGTATVGFNIKNNLTAASALADNDQVAIFQGSSVSQGNKSLNAQLIPPYVNSKNSFSDASTNQTTHTFTHNLNTTRLIVQLVDSSTQETVYASVDRTSINVVTVTTASSASLTCLIQKIG